MEPVELIAEVLKYTLPAVLVLVGVYMVLDSVRKKDLRKERIEIRSQALNKVVPLRLHAYERVVLFLERINPENLIIRADGRGKTVREFHAQLLGEIREEFEHNMAQQIYISSEGWLATLKAKDQVLALINQSARQLTESSTGVDLGRQILSNMASANHSPCIEAIALVKTDIHKTFRLIG